MQRFPEVNTVPDLLAHWSERRGADPFLILPEAAERPVGFAELEAAVRRAAGLLAERGAGPGRRVSLLLSNSPEMVLLFLGSMRLGAVANPLNVFLTAEEIEAILADADPALIVADAENAERLKACGALPAPCFRAEGGLELGLRPIREDGPGKGAPSPEGDALLLFTSGSTGRPKGVRLTHANLLAGARYVAEAHGLSAGDRSLVVLPLYHINGEVVAFLAPLLSGGSIVLPERFRAGPFWRWVEDFRCTWFSAVPTIFTILLQKEAEARPRGTLGFVRFARSASAALPQAVQREFEEQFGLSIIETMGITEGAGMVFTNPLAPERRKVGSVGLPHGNEGRIADAEGNLLPPGREGEVAVRGPNVMPGYFRNPAATAEALVDGWLRTGDLGYVDEEGYFFITGRKKDLINRAGEMIAPREVDEVLYRHPAVQDAAAVGVPHPVYGEEVKAFVVLRRGAACDEEDLLAHCRLHLAEFKCPKSVDFIEEIPKGPSGKLLRRKLRERYVEEGAS